MYLRAAIHLRWLQQSYVDFNVKLFSVFNDENLITEDLPITTGVFTAGTISFDRWNYYHMNILGDDALEITVAESSEDHQLGLIWVFAKKNGRPTIEDNDYRNQSDTSLLTVWIPSTAARGNWTIGITGSPRNHGIFVERATYTLIGMFFNDITSPY